MRKRATQEHLWFLAAVVAGCGGKASVGDDDNEFDASVVDAPDDDGTSSDDDEAPNDDAPAGDDDGADDDVRPGPAMEPVIVAAGDDDIILSPGQPGLSDAGSPDVVIAFDGGDGGVEACGGDAVRATQRDVSLLLVFDQSGSMLAVDGDDGIDRWTKLTQATATTLDAVSDKMALGLELFPHRVPEPLTAACTDEGSCCAVPDQDDAIVVPPAAGDATAPEILDVVSAAMPATGTGTPTAAALDRAFWYFTEGDGQNLAGDRYVLLVTDGGPMCNSELSCEADECIINIDGSCPEVVGNCCAAEFDATHLCLDAEAPREEIEALAAEGILTAVMGIPGTEAYGAQLNAYARAGGLENTDGDTSYYAVTAAGGIEALERALTSITQQLIQSCVLELDEPPPDPMQVNVRIEGELVPQQGDDGWNLDIADGGLATVTLEGETCERVEQEGVESIAVLFGCPTVVRAPSAR